MKVKHLTILSVFAFLLSSWTMQEEQNFELRVGNGSTCLKTKTDIPVILKIKKRFYKRNQIAVVANGMVLSSSGKSSTYVGEWRYIEFVGRVVYDNQEISVALVLENKKTGKRTTLLKESYISCGDKE